MPALHTSGCRSTEFFVCKELSITEFDREGWRIVAEG